MDDNQRSNISLLCAALTVSLGVNLYLHVRNLELAESHREEQNFFTEAEVSLEAGRFRPPTLAEVIAFSENVELWEVLDRALVGDADLADVRWCLLAGGQEAGGQIDRHDDELKRLTAELARGFEFVRRAMELSIDDFVRHKVLHASPYPMLWRTLKAEEHYFTVSIAAGELGMGDAWREWAKLRGAISSKAKTLVK